MTRVSWHVRLSREGSRDWAVIWCSDRAMAMKRAQEELRVGWRVRVGVSVFDASETFLAAPRGIVEAPFRDLGDR